MISKAHLFVFSLRKEQQQQEPQQEPQYQHGPYRARGGWDERRKHDLAS